MKILFVCTGNINRSAAAEVMARQLHPDWIIQSAATNLKANKPMSKKMRLALVEAGYPKVDFHRSTALSKSLVDWADLVVGFQPSHLKAISDLGGNPISLVEYLDLSPALTKVPDPAFDSSGDTHRFVISLIEQALPAIENRSN
jgi:protein-tyrosine-phosphatase